MDERYAPQALTIMIDLKASWRKDGKHSLNGSLFPYERAVAS
jgi:hypothetical protein